MASGAILSVVGLWNADNTIFDNLVIPSGLSKDDLIARILIECAELEIIFPNPDFFKYTVGVWSRTNIDRWQKLYNTTILDYNPIWNLDVTESDTETRHLIGKDYRTDDLKTVSGSSLTGGNTIGNSGTDTIEKPGFNSATFVTTEKHTVGNTETRNYEDTATNTGTLKHDTADTGTVKHDIKRQGNQGVTSTQQMIKEEREINLYSIYSDIVDSFKRYFCLLIY